MYINELYIIYLWVFFYTHLHKYLKNPKNQAKTNSKRTINKQSNIIYFEPQKIIYKTL